MVVVALLSVDLVESVDLVSVDLVVNCIFIFRKIRMSYIIRETSEPIATDWFFDSLIIQAVHSTNFAIFM